MGKPAKKPAAQADPFDGLDAVDPGVDPFAGLDDVPPAPPPQAEPERAARMATFEDFMSRGEVPRTQTRGIDAPLGPTKGEAAAAGLRAGASLRHDDEAAGYGAWLAGHLPRGTTGTDLNQGDFAPAEGEIQRAAGRGAEAPLSSRTDYEVGRDAERANSAMAQEHHPYVFGASELAGGAAPAALGGAGVPAGMSKIGAAALEGAEVGGAYGHGASEAETPLGVARDTAVGAATGAGTGGLMAAGAPIMSEATANAGNAVAAKLRGAAETAHEIGTEQRLAGAGVERAGMRKLREKGAGYGSEAERLDRYAEGADRMKIGKGRLLPSTVRQHAEDAANAAEAANARGDAIVKQLDAAGTTIHGADVGAAIRKIKAGHGRAVGKQLDEVAAEFDAMGEVPWATMNLERKDIGAGTAWDSGSVRAKLSKKIYGAINEAMEGAAEKAVPGAGAEWRAANEDFHVAEKLNELGENKLNQAGNRAASPSDQGAAVAGYFAGGPVAAAGMFAGNKIVRAREHAVAANLARGAETALNAGAQGAEALGRVAPVAGSKAALLEQLKQVIGPTQSPGAGMPAMANTESPREKRIAQLKEIVNGTGSRAADMATADPAHGEQLAQEPQGKERDMRYAHLVASDPAFRARERARSQEQEEE